MSTASDSEVKSLVSSYEDIKSAYKPTRDFVTYVLLMAILVVQFAILAELAAIESSAVSETTLQTLTPLYNVLAAGLVLVGILGGAGAIMRVLLWYWSRD